MENSLSSLAVVALLFVSFALPPSKASDADGKSSTFAATQSSKQKQRNVCLARYRDCVRIGQIPSTECQYIYQDCTKQII
jgi:hypothetical protein